MQKVKEAINTAINAAVAINVFADQAPKEEDFPYIVFNIVGDIPTLDFDTNNTQDLSVEIEILGDKAIGSEAIGDTNETLFDALQGSKFTPTDNAPSTMTCLDRGTQTIEEDSVIISSLWLVQATEFV